MEELSNIARLIRYFCLKMTDEASSGHPTSSLSAVELMTTLFFGGYLRFNVDNPKQRNNDHVIFSKGHASPLFYSLWAVAGGISSKELSEYRKFNSPLEGHPSMKFPFTVAPTGSLGQGLSIGLGMSILAQKQGNPSKTYVLLGDSEMAEGSNWEAIELASHYNARNLIGIIDVNRLGQAGETMLGSNAREYQKRVSAFGWETIVIDGHDFKEISHALSLAQSSQKPFMIIAKTIKGKGLKNLEDKNGFHGKALPHDEIGEAYKEIGQINTRLKGRIAKPFEFSDKKQDSPVQPSRVAQYNIGDLIATRKAYGQTLVELFPTHPSLVVLDGEVSNSTYAEIFKKEFPGNYFEMYIAEQNMAGVSLGMERMGALPFVSTFAAFWSRAFDQLRMAGYAKANLKFCGSHSGVSIGKDGSSQMGLEDIALFRSIQDSVVLYPSDAVSCQKLVFEMADKKGLCYLRTTRNETPVIYSSTEAFPIGGSKTLKKSSVDRITVVGAGITLHEALKAYDELLKDKIKIRIIDLYSIKPIDSATLERAGKETAGIIVVEDHRDVGGISDAVRSCLAQSSAKIYSLAVNKMPMSGESQELLSYEEIDSKAIVKKVRELIT